MTSMDVGAAGELLVASEFIKRGLEVYHPAASYPVDLLVLAGDKAYKIQVKTSCNGGKQQYRFRGTRNRAYPQGSIDYYAVVHLPTSRMALIPAGTSGSATVDFDQLNREWEFDRVIRDMCEGGSVCT